MFLWLVNVINDLFALWFGYLLIMLCYLLAFKIFYLFFCFSYLVPWFGEKAYM